MVEAPTHAELLNDLQSSSSASYAVKYQARLGDDPEHLQDVGQLAVYKQGSEKERVDAIGDVARIGLDDASVFIDGADAFYYCSKHLPVSDSVSKKACISEREAVSIFLSGVGLSPSLTAASQTDKISLLRSWRETIAQRDARCYEIGNVEHPDFSSIMICFDNSGAPMYRGQRVGTDWLELNAFEVSVPADTDFAVPYDVVGP